MLEVVLSGALIAKFIEWLKFKKWFPVNYDEKNLLRIANVVFAVVVAFVINFLSNSLDFSSIDGIRAFANDVVGLIGTEIVVYAGFIKKSPEEKVEAQKAMLNPDLG